MVEYGDPPMRMDDGVPFRIEGNGADRAPVAGVARPARRLLFPGTQIHRMASRQDRLVFAGVTLGRTDIANAAMPVIDVVPLDEIGSPDACRIQTGEAPGRKLGAVLGGAKQRLGVGVVVADAGARVRRLDAEPVEHGQHRRGFQGGTVIAVQDRFGAHGGNPLGQRRAAHQMDGMVGMIAVMDLPADDLAAVKIEDQVKMEPAASHLDGQVGHVPTPDLTRRGGDVRRRRPAGPGRLGAPAACGLSVFAQEAAEGRFAGQIEAFVGQHGDDAGWRYGGKARLLGHRQHPCPLGFGKGVPGNRAHRLRPAVPAGQALTGLPALQCPQVNAGDRAGRLEPRPGGVCAVDVSGQRLAIFEADHPKPDEPEPNRGYDGSLMDDRESDHGYGDA